MRIVKLAAVFLVILTFFATMASAGQVKRTALLSDFSGRAEVKDASGKWQPAAKGMVLGQGDVIRTLKDSSAQLALDGDIQSATVNLKQNSQLTIAELYKDQDKNSQNTLLDLALGEVLIKTKKLQEAGSRFEVKTPTSIVGVRGTEFSVAVEAVEQ
jgi:hypothetical protein